MEPPWEGGTKVYINDLAENLQQRTIFSNIFSETNWPINAKFHVNPPWEMGKKVYINGTGQ